LLILLGFSCDGVFPALLFPSSQPPLKEMHQAARLLQTGQFPAATEAYEQILKLSPGDEAATLGLAAYRGV
jgi:thioredoxin-like negative regulator of GroEL